MRGSTSLRRLIPFAIATALLIAGLLGMHTFTAAPGGHSAVSAAHTTHSVEHVSGTASTENAADCDGTCLTAPAGHDEMQTACVLALLFGLLLVIAPALRYRLTPTLQLASVSARWRSRSARPHPPSLIVLSISRT